MPVRWRSSRRGSTPGSLSTPRSGEQSQDAPPEPWAALREPAYEDDFAEIVKGAVMHGAFAGAVGDADGCIRVSVAASMGAAAGAALGAPDGESVTPGAGGAALGAAVGAAAGKTAGAP